MSIFEILNTLLLKPLELVFEVVYMLACRRAWIISKKRLAAMNE